MDKYEALEHALEAIVNGEGTWNEKRDAVQENVDKVVLEEFLTWFEVDICP